MDKFFKAAFKALSKSPELIIGLFFMYFCGLVLTAIYIRPRLEESDLFKRKDFIFGAGILPGVIITSLVHGLRFKSFPLTTFDIAQSVIPGAVILCGITTFGVALKVIKR